MINYLKYKERTLINGSKVGSEEWVEQKKNGKRKEEEVRDSGRKKMNVSNKRKYRPRNWPIK